jgi:hypothetical protein
VSNQLPSGQQPAAAAGSAVAAAAARSQPTNSVLLQGVFYIQQQQFLVGCDIVTREACNCYSLNVNILGKIVLLHFALAPFCG